MFLNKISARHTAIYCNTPPFDVRLRILGLYAKMPKRSRGDGGQNWRCPRFGAIFAEFGGYGIARCVDTVHCTLHIVHCTVYNMQYTVYSVQCTLYIVNGAAYMVHVGTKNIFFRVEGRASFTLSC